MSNISRNFVYNLILTISNIIFPIVTFPYASRILGPIGIGRVQFVNTFVQYFILIAALGIPIYGIREIAKVRHEPRALKMLFSELVSLNLIMSLLLFIIYASCIYFVPSLRKDSQYYALAVLMLIVGFCNVDWFFSGLERFKFIAYRSIVVKFASVAALFVFVRDKGDDLAYLGIIVGVFIFNNAWNMWSARSYFSFKNLSHHRFKLHLMPLAYIFGTVAAISVYSLMDTIILGFLKDFEAVGYYAAATRITKITIPVLTSLGTVLIPQIAEAFKRKDMEVVKFLTKNSLSFVIMLGIPLTIGLIILAPEIVVLFSGHAFFPATLTMQVFAPVVLIIGLSNVWAIQVLTPSGNDKFVTISVVIGLILSLFLNFLLIPKFSYNGAAVANLLSELAVMASFIFFTSKIVKVDFDFKFCIKTLFASLTFIPVIMLVRYWLKDNEIGICILGSFTCSLLYGFIQYFLIKNEFILKQVDGLKSRFIV